MPQFTLPDVNGSFTLDTHGHVFDEKSTLLGTWTTDADKNLIRISKLDGSTHDVAVAWAFNTKNQLTISYNNVLIHVLAVTVTSHPNYSLDKNLLVVDPDGDRNFVFRLNCKYSFDPKGNLFIRINETSSSIKGYISGLNSRLTFRFNDLVKMTGFGNTLLFSGVWEKEVDEKRLKLSFKLDGNAGIDGLALQMPSTLSVDPQSNQLYMSYDSDGYGSRTLAFAGQLTIGPNWTLNFDIINISNGVSITRTYSFETNFQWQKGNGSIVLHMGKNAADSTDEIEIGGALSAALSNGVLTCSFSYKKSGAAATATRVVATNISFHSNNGELTIQYSQDGDQKKCSIEAVKETLNMKITAGAGLNIAGDTRSVSLFLGIAF